jgi:hypothetical protein
MCVCHPVNWCRWCRSDEASLVRYLNPQEVQQHMQVRRQCEQPAAVGTACDWVDLQASQLLQLQNVLLQTHMLR